MSFAACLKNQPLLTPENAYDPRLALSDDSLSTYDRLEIVLVDEQDTGRVIRIWKGHPDSLGVLETEFTGEGRTLLFLVRGYRVDELCLSEIIAQDGRIRHKALLCHVDDPVPIDSPVVRVPARILRGKVTDWDSIPVRGMTVTLNGARILVTDSGGNFNFGSMDTGTYFMSASGKSRMSGRDTVRMDGQDTISTLIRVSPVIGVKVLPLTWSRDPGPVAAFSGRGLIPSMGFDQPGIIADIPLVNFVPSLQRFHDLGNGDGEAIPTYFEPGDLVADSQALFLAYPEDSHLGRIGNWRSQPVASNTGIGMQPGALLLEGGGLIVLGRLGDGTLALGEYRKKDLSLERLDTLRGFAWDGVVPLQRSPRLVAMGSAFYAIEGNSPAQLGRLIRIDKVTRTVSASVELEDVSPSDLATHGGRIYVTFPASTLKVIRIYDQNLQAVGTIPAEDPVQRIAFAVKGRFAGYGFFLAGTGITIFNPQEPRQATALPIPSYKGAGHLALDPESGQAIVSDGTKVLLIGL